MNFQLDIVEIILLSGLGLSFLIQMIYYLVFYSKPLRFPKKAGNEQISASENAKSPVSIVICSRNESQNLAQYLPLILEQDYPLYEVIVVNDGSTDESDQVLSDLEEKYKHLYTTYIPEDSKYLSRKKLAMMVGIKAAKYDYLLFTEACCSPVGKDWISCMMRNFSDTKSIVLGFSPLKKGNSLKDRFAAYDNLIDGLRYLSFAIMNRPYSGNGRNMAYKKSLFFENKGFSKYMYLQSGEDDLFINQIATSENTAVELAPESMQLMQLEDFKLWKEIKLCRATTQHHYKPGPVAFWRCESISRLFFGIFAIAAIVYGFWGLLLPTIAVFAFLARLTTQLLVINKSAKKLNTGRFYYLLPLFDFFQLLFDFYIYISRLKRGKKDYIGIYS
jgi:glycosyltransferase involved in cell wall biosynthesis